MLVRLVGAAALASLRPRRAAAADPRPLVVGSKGDTEGALLGHLIAGVLERLGLTVERRLGLGPTLIVRAALLAGELDLYPEYTGNVAFFSGTETDPAWKAGETAYATARRLDAARGLVWLGRAPADNTWCIAVNGGLARTENLVSMADFARAVRADRIRLAASTEFVESPAALPAFEAAYDFRLPLDRIVSLPGGDTAVTARAAAEGISGINAGMVYGTDGALSALDLAVMSDPKRAQIVYEPAPVIRAQTLERHPEIRAALDPLFAALDAETLRRLNAAVAVEGRTAEAVAAAWLAGRAGTP
ncbi:osmoprotectant transport system substrate-binding protein [Methylorubrum rhodinum]|uniref:Osmoprotectant transport system substrate-binding protein n=1 Tax=Methylorubrum rhodinum TaxID=29428 RepID=A0A840ZJM3_9HYPH|nr:glycine betaine ABC transporter substrate-binding protein [Methylorubrum rhodinum]MBB5757295.1 osmoprotectant transport system substrate-binding protein [Methylorubrum rhodinum]